MKQLFFLAMVLGGCLMWTTPAWAIDRDDDVRADFVPLEVGGIFFGRQADLVAIDDEIVPLDLDVFVKTAVHRVILQHVSQIIRIEEVVDADDLNVAEALDCSAENHTADAAKTIDAYFDGHLKPPKSREKRVTKPFLHPKRRAGL